MNLSRTVRSWAATIGLALVTLSLGCEQAPPPPNPAALDQELKQLDEHRQQEWGDTK